MINQNRITALTNKYSHYRRVEFLFGWKEMMNDIIIESSWIIVELNGNKTNKSQLI